MPRTYVALLILMVACMVAADGVTSRTAGSTSTTLAGDADCDGDVTPADALDLLGTANGLWPAGACAETNGDLTCDARVDQADVLEVLAILAAIERAECGGEVTSFGIIQKAADEGQISEGQAALYSVLAAFGDPRLPPQYAGAVPAGFEMPVDMNDIGSRLGGFPSDVRQQLEPFFIPPMHAGSWWDERFNGATASPAGLGAPGPILDGQWSSHDAQTAPVKFWYPAGDFTLSQLAASTAQEIDSHVWPQLTALMARGPLPDGGSFMPGRGGDDRLDIIVSNDLPTFGALGLPPNWCERTAAMIFANPGLAASLQVPFHIGVAHEIMHAIQFSYDVATLPGGSGGCAADDAAWWAEATATWTEHFLYPNVNTEHTGPRGGENVKQFVGNLTEPLESRGDPYRGINLLRPYGAYVWVFYLAHEYGNAVVRQVWEGMQSADLLGALDAVVSAVEPEGLAKVWPDFAVAALNKEPFDLFRQWDGVEQEPDWNGSTYRDHEEIVEMASYHFSGGVGFRFIDWSSQKHLSATANSYRISGEDVRSITFYNGFAYGNQEQESEAGRFFVTQPRPLEELRGLKVEALIKVEGQEWVREDWTYYPVRTFCRDVAAERVEEVIIIASNSVPEKDYEVHSGHAEGPPPTWGPLLVASDIGCWRWEGSVESVVHGDGWEMTTSVKGLMLNRDPSQVTPYAPMYGVNFIPVAGTMDWSISGSQGGCTVQGSESGLALVQQHAMGTFNEIIEGPFARSVSGAFYPQMTFLPYTLSCPGDEPEHHEWPAAVTFPLSEEPLKVEDGRLIEGSMHHAGSNTDLSWRFEAQRE